MPWRRGRPPDQPMSPCQFRTTESARSGVFLHTQYIYISPTVRPCNHSAQTSRGDHLRARPDRQKADRIVFAMSGASLRPPRYRRVPNPHVRNLAATSRLVFGRSSLVSDGSHMYLATPIGFVRNRPPGRMISAGNPSPMSKIPLIAR